MVRIEGNLIFNELWMTAGGMVCSLYNRTVWHFILPTFPIGSMFLIHQGQPCWVGLQGSNLLGSLMCRKLLSAVYLLWWNMSFCFVILMSTSHPCWNLFSEVVGGPLWLFIILFRIYFIGHILYLESCSSPTQQLAQPSHTDSHSSVDHHFIPMFLPSYITWYIFHYSLP